MPTDSAYVRVHADEFAKCMSSKEMNAPWSANVPVAEQCGQKLLADATGQEVSADTRKELIRTASTENHKASVGNDHLPLLNAIVNQDGEITKFQLEVFGWDNRVNPTKVIDLK